MKKLVNIAFVLVFSTLLILHAAEVNWRGYVIVQDLDPGPGKNIVTKYACRDSLERNLALNKLVIDGVDTSDIWVFEHVIEFDTTGGLVFDSLNCVDITTAMRLRMASIKPY